MNLSARIKNSKTKQNYILNVNINIPFRPPNLADTYRPLSGQFTFSPNNRSKRLKLQLPSARTTNQCQSRKISYLNQTQNTISHRNQANIKRTIKSAYPSSSQQHITRMFNNTNSYCNSNQIGKYRSQVKSQAVSPHGKKDRGGKKGKGGIGGNGGNWGVEGKGREIVRQMLSQSQDGIIGYTNQSSQLEKGSRKQGNNKSNEGSITESFQDKNKLNIKTIKFKSQSPMLEQQKGLIYGIRQFQKSAQLKKQHLNYEYLKQKVLVLASVKKIQRAWRNYKTKKLIKSYSNNISLKFTGKLKNQIFSNQQPQQNKILTVRSCGFSGHTNDFKKQGKKHLSQLYPQQYQQIQQQDREKDNYNRKDIDDISFEKKKKASQIYSARENKMSQKNMRDLNSKSAIVQFQMEEIRKWEELINNIRQGKKVDEVLEKSFRRKQELEKQLSENLIELNTERFVYQNDGKGQDMVEKYQKYQDELSQKEIKNNQKLNNISVGKQNKIPSVPSVPSVSSQVSVSSSDQPHQKLIHDHSPSILSMQNKLMPIQADKSCFQQSEQGATTQRRREKLQYFQNQLRKIDNEYSQSNLSRSHHSQSQIVTLSPQDIHLKHSSIIRQSQQQQNNKLKRKIQAMARIKMFEYTEQQHQEEVSIEQQKQKDKTYLYTYTSIQRVTQITQKDKQSKTNTNTNTNTNDNTNTNTNTNANTNKDVQMHKKHESQKVYEEDNDDYFPLTINPSKNANTQKKGIKNSDKKQELQAKIEQDDRLETFRKKASQQISHNIIYEDLQNLRLKQLQKKKLSWTQKQQLSSKVEQQIFYDLLLQFSEQEHFITKMEGLYFKISKKKEQEEKQKQKPQGICTNLESIKDYLQNFVAFAFEQQPNRLLQGFNQSRNMSALSLLKQLANANANSNSKSKSKSTNEHNQLYLSMFNHKVLSEKLFDQHWDYASEQIYFDAKFPNDPNREQQRVKYLKAITKMYFRAIFDGFNQCLQPYRVHGLAGKYYPWQPHPSKKPLLLNLQQIKPLIRLGYRKLSQIAIIYCGLLFEDKKHSMSAKMVQQIQKQRLDTLVEIQLQDEEYKWAYVKVEKVQVLWSVYLYVMEEIVSQVCQDVMGIGGKRAV